MKRLLVVANPFPPLAGAGTTRVLRMIRHLPDNGWEPTVLTTDAQGPATPPDFVRVVRTPVPVPARLLHGGRHAARLSGWLFVPDAYAPWIPTAIAGGRRLLAEERFDAILSSHPRASAHVVAASLARRSGVPWMADYRDRRFANTVVPFATPVHATANKWLEARTLRQAAAVSAINQPILDDITALHPWLAGRGHVLPNGYDDTETAEPAELGPGFWFVYTGKIYRREKPLETFLEAFATLPDDVKALFAGDAGRVQPVVDRLGLGARVRAEGVVPHATALGYQRAADALLLVTHRRPESMSSKVFEYLRAGHPLFVMTTPDTAAGRLLSTTGGSVMVDYDGDVRAALTDFVAAVRDGRGPTVDTTALARFDMAVVTAELAAALDRISMESDAR